MRALRVGVRWLRNVLRRSAAERELEAELAYHLDRQTEENVVAGMSPREAREAARREFGGPSQLAEQCRDTRGGRFLEDFASDLRYGMRGLRKSPGFAAVVIVTLALGIGANVAVFSLIDAVMLRSLPVEDPDQLLTLVKMGPDGRSGLSFSYPGYLEFQNATDGVADLLATSRVGRSQVQMGAGEGRGVPEDVFTEFVSGSYFDVLGVTPQFGRMLGPDDDIPSESAPVVVISHNFWERRFGRSFEALGAQLSAGPVAFTIVGIAPPEFFGVQPGRPADVWLTTAMQPVMERSRSRLEEYGAQWLAVMARPHPGVPAETVEAAMKLGNERILEHRYGSIADDEERSRKMHRPVGVVPGRGGIDTLRTRYSQPLFILMAAVVLVLLIACANVANLLLARASARQHEVCVRSALGAAQTRLVRQWMTESLLLAAIGAAMGIVFAFAGSRALLALLSFGTIPVNLETPVDLRLLAVTAVVATTAAIIFGLAPALHVGRADLRGAFASSANGTVSPSVPLGRRRLLSVGQIALSLVLLIGAGLLLRTVSNLRATDLGFGERSVVMAYVMPGDERFQVPRGDSVLPLELAAAEDRVAALYQRLAESLRAIPGARSVSASGCGVVFVCSGTQCCLEVAGQTTPLERARARVDSVDPAFWNTHGIKLLAGRNFTPTDLRGAPSVAIVNQRFAAAYGRDRPVVGTRIRWSEEGEWVEVVGLVEDVNHNGPKNAVQEFVYYPFAQKPHAGATLSVLASGPASAIAQDVRRALREEERDLVIHALTTVEQQLDDRIAQERLLAALLGVFGWLALAITSVGIYGVLSYSVSRRTTEFGLRKALGAQQARIIWRVMRETVSLVGFGVVLGLVGAAALVGWIRGVLSGVDPYDPTTVAGAVAAIASGALLATWLPAYRAARVDPMRALRDE